jgi:hypothetical protein
MTAFGLTPFGGPALGPVDLGRAASRLEGVGAYPRFPEDVTDRVHAQELGAIGAVAAVAASTLDRACAQAFVDLATELLDAHERNHRLPNDSARQLASRWERLVAAETFRDVDLASYVAAINRIVPYLAATAATDAVNWNNVIDTYGLEPWTSFQYVVSVGAHFDDAVKRRAVELLLRRMPTYRLGQMGANGTDRVIVEDASAKFAAWNSATSRLDRAPLTPATSTDGDGYESRNAPSRVRSYGPQSRIDARDLNAIQDAVSAGSCSSWTSTMPEAGYHERYFTLSVGAGADVQIDNALDFRYRMLRLSLIIDAADIRPAGAAEANANLLTVTQRFDAMGFWSAGGLAEDIDTVTSGVRIYAELVTGYLRCKNGAGATRYVVGMIGVSEPLG